MSAQAEEVLNRALRANRQMLAVLDRELTRGASYDDALAEVLAECNESIVPVFLDVVGADKNPGVLIPANAATSATTPFFGLWQLPPAAPFVATSIAAVVETFLNPAPATFFGPLFTENLDVPGINASAQPDALTVAGLRIFDVANQSNIVSLNAASPNGATSPMLPLSAIMGQVNAGMPADWPLDETVFPAAAALRVELFLRQADTFGQPRRLHLILAGYKVFEE